MSFSHHTFARAVRRLFAVCILFAFAGVAHAAISWNLPSTSSTGSYTITWSGARTFVEIYENVNGTWIKQTNNGPTGSWTVSGKGSGTYTYYINDCLADQSGTPCAPSSPRSITVTLTTPIPGAPASVSASVSGSSIAVLWTAVSDATSYKVFRSGSQIATPASNSYTDSSVSSGNSYTYSIQACNSNGCSTSTSSNTVSLSTPAPAAPSSVSANVSNGFAYLSWPPVSGASYYFVRQQGMSSPSSTTLTTSSFPVAGGKTYTFEVSACNNTNVCSAYTASNSVTTGLAAPVAPGGVTAKVSGSYVVLSWTPVDGAASYTIQKTTGGTTSTIPGVNTNGYTDTAVSPGTTYTYSIISCNSAGCSAASTQASVTTPPLVLPATPTSVTATLTGPTSVSNSSVVLSWGPVSGASSYTIQKTTGGTTSTISGVSTNSYTDTAVRPGTTYAYSVLACNSNGCSSPSTQVSVTTPPLAPPAAPPSITATVNGSTVALSWPAVAFASLYKLKRVNGSTATALDDVLCATSTTDSSVGVDASYVYQVQACNSAGCSGWTSSAAVKIAHIPAPPSPVNVVVRQNLIYISWPNIDNATSFKLTRNGTQISPSATSPYADSNVTKGTSYTYGVSACNITGCSSVALSATIVAGTVQVGGKVVESYDYNVLGRLVKVKEDGTTKTQYDYDNAGNRKQVNE